MGDKEKLYEQRQANNVSDFCWQEPPLFRIPGRMQDPKAILARQVICVENHICTPACATYLRHMMALTHSIL